MPARCTTPRAKIDEALKKSADRLKTAILNTLYYIGERVVAVARTTSMKGRDFKDDTGNLRSSIGYVVTYNGAITKLAGFDAVLHGGEGVMTGKDLAEKLANEAGKGYTLIVVAGMHYAKYVSARGYDVLDSAEMTAEGLANRLLTKLNNP